MNSICVFCGSCTGDHEDFSNLAETLGYKIAENNLDMVYGGGKVGLMGVIADAILSKNGKVTGIIPEFLYHKEVGHENLTKLLIVDSMHERKQKMAEIADAFIAMPGVCGTLEELAEIITWNQLSPVTKPVGILNVNGFYDYFDLFIKNAVDRGFIDTSFYSRIVIEADPEVLSGSSQSWLTKAMKPI